MQYTYIMTFITKPEACTLSWSFAIKQGNLKQYFVRPSSDTSLDNTEGFTSLNLQHRVHIYLETETILGNPPLIHQYILIIEKLVCFVLKAKI